MKKTIYKYDIKIDDKFEIQLPIGAEILSVQIQYGDPKMWVLVDPAAPIAPRVFEVFGTGHPIHYDMGIDRRFIGTFQIQDGRLVFHLFERID